MRQAPRCPRRCGPDGLYGPRCIRRVDGHAAEACTPADPGNRRALQRLLRYNALHHGEVAA